MGNGDDTCATGQANRWLDAHDTVDTRGTENRAVSLGTERDSYKVRRDGSGRARAGAAGGTVERVGVDSLPTTRAPAAGRMGRAKVGPLAHVCLAQQDRARRAQPGGDKGVLNERRISQ